MRRLSQVILFSFGVLFSVSVLAQPWDITGNVSGPGGVVVGTEVQVNDDSGGFLSSTVTDGSGNYTLQVNSSGDYYVSTPVQGMSDTTLKPVVYPGTYCANCDVTNVGVSPINVSGNTPSIDFVLETGGVISGSISTSGAVPITNGDIAAFDINGTWIGSTNPDGSGNFAFALPDDTYWIQAEAYGAFEYYVTQFHDDSECPWQQCNPYENMPGITTSPGSQDNFVFVLFEGMKVSGTVTEAGTSTGIDNVDMQFRIGSDVYFGMSTVNGGSYETPALPVDSYHVVANGEPAGYVTEIYDDIICPGGNCDPVVGGATQLTTTAGNTDVVDFGLDTGRRFSGVIDDLQGPAGNGYVRVFLTDGTFLQDVWPDGSGYYESPLLAPGLYFAYAWGEDFGHVTQLYDGIPCPHATCDTVTLSTHIDLTSGDQGGVNFTLVEQNWAYRISGTITTAGGGAEQGGAARVWDGVGNHVGDYWVDENGNWETDQLTNDRYHVTTVHTQGVMDELWDWGAGTPCPNQDCDPLSDGGIDVNGGDFGGIDIVLDPAAGGRIHGTISTDNGSTPLPNVLIEFFNASGIGVVGAWTDDSGNYISPWLVGEDVYVRTRYEPFGLATEFYNDKPCKPDCYNSGWIVANADAVNTAGGDVTGIDIDLALPGSGYTISGDVVDEELGHTLPQVHLVLFDTDGNEVDRTDSDSEGSYYFTGLSNGDYRVYAEGVPQNYDQELFENVDCPDWSCDFSSDGTLINITDGDNGGNNIVLDFNGDRIFGTITRSDSGNPVTANIGYMRVDAFHPNGDWAGEAYTNSKGQYTLFLGPGDYRLHTSLDVAFHGLLNEHWVAAGDNYCDVAFGCDSSFGDLVTVDGINTPVADFVLDPGATISGNVSGGGNPLGGVEVCVTRRDGWWLGCTRSESSGDYTVVGLPFENDLLVFINDLGGHSFQRETWNGWPGHDWENGDGIDVSSSNATGKDFTLEAGYTISGTVLDGGSPVADIGVCVHYKSSGDWTGFCAGTDGSGNYTTDALPPSNDYIAYAIGYERGYKEQIWDGIDCDGGCDLTQGDAIDLTSSDATGIDFNVTPSNPGTISGHIWDNNDQPNPGGAVVLYDKDGNWYDQFWVDENGYFETYPIPTGSYYARTKYVWGFVDDVWDGNDGYQCPNQLCNPLDHEPIGVGSGENIGGIDFRLDAIDNPRYIRGHVEDGSGTPIEFLRIVIANSNGDYLSEIRTNEAGNYESSPLLNDIYYAHTSPGPMGLRPEIYDDAQCISYTDCDDPYYVRTDGTPIDLVIDANNVDFVLEFPPGWTISGQVTDSGNGRALTDVSVQLRDSAGNFLGEFQTDSEGKYYFSGLPNDSYGVFVSGPPQGYAYELYSEIPCPDWSCDVNAGTPIVVQDGDEPNHNIALDYTGTRIFGTVTRTDNGDPVSSNFGYMGVNLFDDAGNQIGGTGTDAAGNFQLHLPAGTASYYLATDHDTNYHALINECWDDLQCSDWFDPAGAGADLILVPDGTTVTRDFVLDSAIVISGTITATDGGAPIAGVQLDFQDDQGNYVGSTSTAANGNYKFAVPGPGDYLVFIPPYGVQSPYLPEVWPGIHCNFYVCDLQATGTLITVGGSSVTGRDFSLESGFTISGEVLESSNPVDGVGVCVHLKSDGSWAGVCGGTNGSGAYTTGGLPAGNDYVAYAIPDEFGFKRQIWDGIDCNGGCNFSLGDAIDLTSSSAINIDFNLNPSEPGTISGSVLDWNDENPGGAVILYDQDGNWFDQFWVDDNGDFQTYPIPTGVYYAVTKYTWGVVDDVWDGNDGSQCPNQLCNPLDHEPIRVSSGEAVTGINFRLDTIDNPRHIRGHVEDGSANPVEFMRVVVRNLNGEYLREVRTDPSGNYDLGPLLEDFYYVTTSPGPGGLAPEIYDNVVCGFYRECEDNTYVRDNGTPIELTADANNIDFVLGIPAGWIISGQVTDSGNGRPLANVNLSLFDEFENYFGEFQTDAEGKYYFSGLPNGSYRILINGVPEGYDVELYSEIFCADWSCSVAAGTPIEVADGDQPSHDIALDYTGTRIFGTVTRTDNGDPVSSDFGYMGVNLFNDAGEHIGGTGTDRAGNYQLHLPGGTASYFVATSHDQGYHALLDECWDDVKCPNNFDPLNGGADLILVPDGTTVTADFVLDPAQVISGTVTESVGVTPIQGVQLDLWDQFGNYITSASTASDGSYKLPVPGPGEYYVFTPDYGVPAPYLPEVWNNAYCNISLGCDPVTTGNAVIVTGSANTTGIDFSLDQAASISGTVTSSVDGLPVAPQARLHALDGAQLTGVNGNPDGTYLLGGILPGTYYLLLNNRNGPLIDELFDDVKCPRFACDFAALGTQITVSVGEQLTGYDAALDPGSQISGTVTVDGAPPAEFTNLLIYDENGTYAGFAFTDASGNYQSRSGLPAGSYFVTFGEPSSESGYVATAWPNADCGEPCDPTLGDPVVVNGVDPVAGIDFDLIDASEVTISGTVTSDIGAVPIEGIRMTVSRKSDGARLQNTFTDASGQYQFILNEARDDLVVWTRTVSPQPYFAEVYDGIRCTDGFCDLDEVLSGTSIDVTTGSKIINLSLSRSASISGTISRSDPAGLLGSFEGRARLYRQSDHSQVAIAFTDANGFYRLVGFDPGDYYLLLSGSNNNLIDELYDDASGIYCPLLTCDTTPGRVFSFSGTEDEENINGILDPGTQFSGHVSENGVPLDNIFINFYTESGVVIGSGRTANDGSGNYVTAFGVPAGNYRASNRWIVDGVQQPGNDQYVATAYLDTPCGTPCDVTAGDIIVAPGTPTVVPNIDFAFEDASASISGNITGSDTGLAIENISLWLFDLDCNYIDYGVTDSNGDYVVPVNVPGSFYLFAIASDTWDINLQTGYINQQYPGINVHDSCYPPVNDVTLGEVIVVAESQKLTGKDFVLDPGGTITGTISDGSGVLANETAVARLYRASDGAPQKNAINKEPDGSYHMGGLMPGTYQVVLSSFSSGLIDERYADEHCPRNSCDPGLGNVIEIITGLEVIPGVDAVLESGAVIRGQLTDSQSGLPVTDYCVWIYNQLGVYATLACSDANGDFESATGLPDGNYRLSNQLKNPAYQPVNGGYIPQVWTNDGTFLACGAECDFTLGDTFTVNGTNPVENINLAMQKAIVTLSGTVLDHNGLPMPNVAVDVLNSEGSLVDSAAFTDSEGFWSKPVVSYSTYYAKTIGEWAPAHQAEIWDDIPCDECDAVAVGTPILVTDTDVGGIDFQLSLLDVGSNLGFETGDLTSWILAGSGDKSVGAPGVGAQEGSYAARLTVPATATADVGNILQIFDASPGDEFYLSGYMLTESPQGASFGILKIEFTDASGNILIPTYASKGFNDPDFPGINSEPVLDGNSPSNEWVFSEAQGVAPPGTTQVFFQLIYVNITAQEQSMWFDNIHMVQVPSEAGTEVISGTVTADDGGALLGGINVCVANKTDDQVDACAITDSLGKYLIGNLAPANDYVVYTRDVGGQAFFREMYDSQSCCDIANGTSVDLSGGSAVIDFGLAASGRIAGFVKDSTTDVGIANVLMLLLDESCATVDVVETYTDAGATLGEYSISGVPDGTYYLMAAGEYQGYINELYPDEKRVNPCVGDFPVGQAIIIENLSEVENVDFALDLGGSISGVISDVNGMLPFNRAQMRLHDADGTLIGVYGSWQTDWTPDVSYIAGGLLPGTYQVILSSSNLGLVDELYDDIPCPRFSCGNGLATEVIVGPAEHVTGIDAVLEPGSTISGNITDKASGLPLPFYSIAFYSDSGAYAGFGFSDVNGDYTTSTGFPAGGYLASNQFNTDPVAQGYLPMVYPNRTCGEPCNFLLGDEIVVDGVNPEFGIDFELETGTAISGVVTTGGGATPLANITLQLRRSTDGAIIRTVVTDGSGAYEFAGVGSGTYFIRTKNTLGYADRLHAGISCNPFCDPLTGTPIGADGFSDITGISFDLPVTPAIAGVVTDAVSTLPVAGVKVQAYDVLGTLIATATSNGAGEYLIQNLYAGNFYVKTANTAGYVDDLWNGMTCLPGCNPTLGTQVPVAATGTVSGIDLDLGSSSKVQGNVSKSAGGALSGVTVQVYSAAGALVGSSITDASGNYSVNGLSEGNYHAVTRNNFGYINKGAGGAVCQPATCAPTSTAVISIVGVNQTLVRDFVLPLGGVVSGTVTNTAAAPLPGVVVRAYNASGTQVGSATSGPAGNYSIAGLAGPVVYLRTTNTAGYQNQRYNGLPCGSTCNVLTGTSVAVSAGVTASGKNFSLALGGSIAGVVKTTTAAPIANVQVQALDALSGVLAGYAVSGPTGAFTVAGLPDGDYRLKTVNSAGYIDRVRGGDHCSPEPCALASGTVTNVASANITGQDITLSLGGAISGVVTTPQEGGLPPIPLPLGTAWIYSETGQLVKQGGIFNGSFFVNGLANGIYHMVVTNGSGLVDQLWEGLPCLSGSCDVTLGAEIVVASAEATSGSSAPLGGVAGGDIGSDQLNFSLDKGYRISGTLKFGTTPIASTKVYFFDAAGKPAGEATTNGLGEFTLDSGLPNGSYFAATSRAARPEDTPDQAADAEDGAVDGLTDEIYDGFACSGVCAPSVDSGIGTPIVIDGADETGIDIVLSAAPGITLEKHTNGVDADTPDGGEAPEIAVGATVNWTYEVTNSGGYDLVNIVVVDNPAVTITCGFSSLAVGESDTCTASGVAQDLSSGGIIGNCSGRPNSHLFQNTATVTAETADVGAVMDEDTSHYCNPDVERPDLIFSDSFEN